jgi:hypothetical protein
LLKPAFIEAKPCKSVDSRSCDVLGACINVAIERKVGLEVICQGGQQMRAFQP